jgi:hypothetical protein
MQGSQMDRQRYYINYDELKKTVLHLTINSIRLFVLQIFLLHINYYNIIYFII